MRNKRIIIAVIIILIPLGLLTKFYSGPGEGWINNQLGGLFYVTFLAVLLYILFQLWKPVNILYPVITALVITSFLEFMQLWKHPVLENIRSTFLGRTIVGNSFNPEDFLFYLMGAALAYFLILWCNRQ